jgi:hypothetical protein
MEYKMSKREVQYRNANKTFLSKEDDEFSSIAWSVEVVKRSEEDVWLSSEIRMSDCSRFINIDMDICLVDPKYTTPEEVAEKIERRLDKIDTLINELTKFRDSYKASLESVNKLL